MDRNDHAAMAGSLVSTPTPDRLLVMLYDRLVLDMRRGIAAIESGDSRESHNQLAHAHDIVMELHSTLNTEDPVGGPGLASLYNRLHTQLLRADMSKDVRIALSCLGMANDLAGTLDRATTTSRPETPEAS